MRLPWPIEYREYQSPAAGRAPAPRRRGDSAIALHESHHAGYAQAPAAAARPQRGDLAVAIHETWHAAVASYFAFPVRSCGVRPLAHTDILMPFEASGVAAAFGACPELALLELTEIVAVLGAQAFAERRNLLQAHESHDKRVLTGYALAYGTVPPRYLDTAGQRHLKPTWRAITENARGAVLRWRQRPGAVAALMAIAEVLVDVGQVDQAGWETLWRSRVAAPLRFHAVEPRAFKKYWVLGASKSGSCQECKDNALINQAGVPEDEPFLDSAGLPTEPPIHKFCVCTVSYERDQQK